jgi:catechol 2,3-dioxygenase-like lactoylglutathione lyase family enzyme
MVQFHHVNLGVPPGGVDDEIRFLVDVLGYQPLEAPEDIRRRFDPIWFEAADGSQVHLSEDPDHRPAARAHVAVAVGDELDTVVERVRAFDDSVKVVDGAGARVAICRVPAGNRWELRG